MQTRWVVVAVVAGWVCAAGAKDEESRAMPPREVRTWTSVSGATVEAKLVFNYGTWCTLEEPDGARLHLRCAYLCEEDKKYLRGFGATRLTFWRRATVSDPDRIDINTCSLGQLNMLPGIGLARARRIIEGRPYRSTKALLKIPGIGQKTYDGFKDDITAVRVKPEPKSRLKAKTQEAAAGA